jgi:hypothetical protein
VLGIGGKFAGAKGMVAVPNLSGLSRSAAQTAITNAGLTFFENTTPVDTTNSSLDNKVSGQSLIAGTLVDYETVVSYSYNRYVAPPPSGPTLVLPVLRITNTVYGLDYQCSGFTRIITTTEQVQISYRYNYSDGTFDIVRAAAEDGPVTLTNDKSYQYNSAECGYVPPALCNSTYVDDPPVWSGACINGTQTGTITARDTTCDGAPITRGTSRSCCIPEQIFVSFTSGSCINCYKITYTTYRDSCTGQQTVYTNQQYCCSGGGGAQVAL